MTISDAIPSLLILHLSCKRWSISLNLSTFYSLKPLTAPINQNICMYTFIIKLKPM